MTFERRLFYYFENLKRQLRTQPLILGGVSISGGGAGGPPGGFIGMLPQSKVTFDYAEDNTTNTIPPSGASLLDNLNRIRYDIANISGGGSPTFLGLLDVDPASYSGQAGYSVVVNGGEDGLEFALISGGGGSGTDDDAIHDNVANEITAITPKTTPVSADEFVIEDSAASFVKKAVTYGNLETTIAASITHVDTDALHVDEANEITGITPKTTPVSADEFVIEDSDASFVKKAVTYGNLETTILAAAGAHTDTDAIHVDVDDEIIGIADKAVPVDADLFLIEDSEASYAKKKLTLGNLAATISGGGGGSPTPDFTYWNPEAPPEDASAYDDEFDDNEGSGVPTGWTEFDPGSVIDWKNERIMGFEFNSGSASDLSGYYKDVSGDLPSNFSALEAITRVSVKGFWDDSQSNHIEVGVAFWEDAADSGAEIVTAGFALKQDTGIGIFLKSYTDYNSLSTTDIGIEGDPPTPFGFTTLWIRLLAVNVFGTYSYGLSYSTGKAWVNIQTDYAEAVFTPTHCGIYLIGAQNNALFHCFRLRGPHSQNSEYAIMGARVNGFYAA